MVNDDRLQTPEEEARLDENKRNAENSGESLSIDFSNTNDQTNSADGDAVASDSSTDRDNLSTVEAAEARYAIDQENFEERQQAFFEADTAERAMLNDSRSVSAAVIAESYEKDQYIRDGNVLYPAPLERPAGANPTFVAEVVEFLQASDEDVRMRADEAAGLDASDRSDSDRLRAALDKRVNA